MEKDHFGKGLLKELHHALTKNTYDTRRWQLGERPGEYKHRDKDMGKTDQPQVESTLSRFNRQMIAFFLPL